METNADNVYWALYWLAVVALFVKAIAWIVMMKNVLTVKLGTQFNQIQKFVDIVEKDVETVILLVVPCVLKDCILPVMGYATNAWITV